MPINPGPTSCGSTRRRDRRLGLHSLTDPAFGKAASAPDAGGGEGHRLPGGELSVAQSLGAGIISLDELMLGCIQLVLGCVEQCCFFAMGCNLEPPPPCSMTEMHTAA